jgi:hypothetical protein
MRESGSEVERLGLTDDEVAFYNALGENDSAAKVWQMANSRSSLRKSRPRFAPTPPSIGDNVISQKPI